MKKLFLSIHVCMLSVFCYAQTGTFSEVIVNTLNVQSATSRPMGLTLLSNTSTANNQGTAYIGLHRKSYISATATGNDMTDNVGLWIKGFYQGVGNAMPVFIGGTGYQNEDCKMMVDKNGNIGIGTVVPGTQFNINQGSFPSYNASDKVLTISTTTVPVLELARPINGTTVGNRIGAIYFTNLQGQSDAHRQVAAIWAENGGGTQYPLLTGGRLVFMTKASAAGVQSKMVFTEQGNLGIGTEDTQGYKLAVAGQMIAERIKVELQGSWPDYVFADDYKLPPLAEVAAYLKENKHLPDMPAAEEVQKNGLDVGEMNKQLLKKVEELTLYLLKQDEKIQQLTEEIKTLKQQ